MKMAFIVHTTDDGRVPPLEYLPCSAITPKIGMALTLSSGNLAIATGTTRPSYISMVNKDAALTAGDVIPVIRVQDDMIFETEFSAAPTSLNIGDKVTLHASSGLSVTATKTNGVAELVYIDGTASGSMCRVRFPSQNITQTVQS